MRINFQPPVDHRGGSTVLVVEDDPALRMLCRVNLELEEYRVLEAESLPRAEELIDSEQIDVVLLDLHIGERNGLELVPHLRETRPSTAICLLSGTSESDPPEIEGVSAFIRKPFQLDVLTETVQRLLAATPAARS